MSYYPNAPQEKPGCLETLIIIRVVFGILLIPVLLLFGAVFTAYLSFYAFSIHPLLVFVPLLAGIGLILLVANWEKARYERDAPKDER